MQRQFDTKDMINMVVMVGLALLLVMKLAITDPERNSEKDEMHPSAPGLLQQANINHPAQINMRPISLPEPPPRPIKHPVADQMHNQMDKPAKRAKPVKTINPIHSASPSKKIQSEKTPLDRVLQNQHTGAVVKTTIKIRAKNHSAMQKGRNLLKILEHGKGPAIQIIWPESINLRNRLYTHLTHCYGMVSALLAQSGPNQSSSGQSSFHKAGHPGVWNLNPDMYSSFLRQPSGHLPEQEHQQHRQIRAQNNLPAHTTSVRLFPREADAILLGSLQQVIGENYMNISQIKGRYVLTNGELQLQDIIMDDRPVRQTIVFSPLNSMCDGGVGR